LRGRGALRLSTAEVVAAITALPEDIRGFDGIKSASIASARVRATALVEQLDRPHCIFSVELDQVVLSAAPIFG
jgi:hypothetical protein